LLLLEKAVVKLKRETAEYLLGERDAIREEVILSRIRKGNSEYVRVSLPDMKEPIYDLWTKRPSKIKKEPVATIEELPTSDIPKPRHTGGGKRPYVMLMQDRDAIGKLSIMASGVLMKLISVGCVEWGTGKVIDKRSKKALTVKMISEKLGLKLVEGKPILSELTTNKVLRYDKSQRAYFLDRNLAMKGSGQSEDKV